jgi:adenylate kinase family enzyme
MEARGMMPLKVIYLDVSDDIAMKRMKENDSNTLARERIKLFNSLVGPLLDYYGEENIIKIDGNKSSSEVSAAINDALK